MPESTTAPSRSEIALSFLKLGTIAFGGPAAHIALMEDEFVRRRGWLSRDEFLDRLAAASVLPGPSSTEMAIFIGYETAGWAGLLIAGCAFILPAAILVAMLAAAYVRFGSVPQVEGVMFFLKPVVVAIVIQAIWRLGRSALKSRWLVIVGLISAVFFALGVHELIVLAAAALLAGGRLIAARVAHASPPALVIAAPALLLVEGVDGRLTRLFFLFFKTGALLFGSGYVLLAFLRADFVERLHWLTEKQLLDAIAIGQATPGPVFTTATFIGYLVGGLPGAVTATAGIFVPAFFLVAASGWMVPRIRRSPIAATLLDGVVVGSLALMAIVAWQLGRAAIVDAPTLLVSVVSAVLLLRYQLNATWLIVAAALIGWWMK